jgi:Zn-dependent protease with chaperone function
MSINSEPSLEAGLTALKQGDFQTAKTILEGVATTTTNSRAAMQAQISLVAAYARSGDITAAITISEILAQSNNPQVKLWAERSLNELLKRNRRDINAHSERDAGFIPFDDAPQSPIEPLALPQEPSDIADEVKNENSASKQIVSTNVLVSRLPKPLTIHWQQAGRAKSWKLREISSLVPLQLLTAGTFFALFWVIRELVVWGMATINNILVWLPFVEPIQALYQNPTVLLLLLLVVITALSPWLLDQLLVQFYNLRHLEGDALDLHSQETTRLLQRYSQKRKIKLPQLKFLPITTPVIFTYGHVPQTTRIVVSLGLLQLLADDEIAALYAEQLAHVAHFDTVVMSLVLLVTIPIYKLYQQLSKWGDRTSQRFINFVYIALSSFVYVIWCLLTGTAICLSKVRLYYADRFAIEFTGNPNGLTRSLLKVAVGIASDIQKQEHTSWQLESLNIALPIGYKQSTTLGSLAPHLRFDSLLMWDYLNPYRYWFTINNTHPLIGDRIQRHLKIARDWHLQTELNIETQNSIRVRKQTFYMQIAPFLAIPIGLIFAAIIGLVWQIAFALKLINLKWIYDNWYFAIGCIAICFSIGVLIRINSFFPDLKGVTLKTSDQLPDLLNNPTAIPIDNAWVSLDGKLLGRRGTNNCLCQDLILQTNTALIKLHHISWLGQPVNPQDFVGRQVTVTGWLRRGATPWVDIQSLKTQSGKIVNSPHPIWSTIVAVAAEAGGAYILLRG